MQQDQGYYFAMRTSSVEVPQIVWTPNGNVDHQLSAWMRRIDIHMELMRLDMEVHQVQYEPALEIADNDSA